MNRFETEVRAGERFSFGANWSDYVQILNDERIEEAKSSLKKMLNAESLAGKRFLDAGSGSGLFSLAARLLGAEVHSFDYDPESLACTAKLKRAHTFSDDDWLIEPGSVLDNDYLASLGQFDIVYSWGVLHHTGDMWRALGNVVPLVKPGGQLYISIYNRQRLFSPYWRFVKRLYNRSPGILQCVLVYFYLVFFALKGGIKDMLTGSNPVLRYRGGGGGGRGMSRYHNMVDWVGGWPFEVAAPEDIFYFYKQHGFILTELSTCGAGHGCNQFVFVKSEYP